MTYLCIMYILYIKLFDFLKFLSINLQSYLHYNIRIKITMKISIRSSFYRNIKYENHTYILTFKVYIYRKIIKIKKCHYIYFFIIDPAICMYT